MKFGAIFFIVLFAMVLIVQKAEVDAQVLNGLDMAGAKRVPGSKKETKGMCGRPGNIRKKIEKERRRKQEIGKKTVQPTVTLR
jgi:hypothetical protein